MTKNRLRNILLVSVVAGFGLSCSTPKNLELKTMDTQGLYGNSPGNDSITFADKPWKEIFTDPHLQNLIEEGLKNNPDLLIALQRVKESEAWLLQGKAALLPGISAMANGNYTHNSASLYPNGPAEVRAYEFGAQANWEIDLWGKLRSAKRSAYANLLSSDAGQKAVQTRLISNIATGYYNLLGLDAKLVITRETVKNNIDLVESMKALKESGKVTGAAIVQSEAARYAAEVTIPDLEQQILETQNFICLLLGRVPGSIERGKLEDQLTPELLKTGVPARLLDHRPDVMQARYELMSAYEITKNARANFYPSLNITASAGFLSTTFENFFDPTYFASNVLAGLTQPIFNKRINTARFRVAKAQQEEAFINFKNTLLLAGQEVTNSLSSYNNAVQKISTRKQQISALIRSVDYTKELLTYGTANYTEVLLAETNLLSGQISGVNDHLQQLNALVTLYRTLGGGWK